MVNILIFFAALATVKRMTESIMYESKFQQMLAYTKRRNGNVNGTDRSKEKIEQELLTVSECSVLRYIKMRSERISWRLFRNYISGFFNQIISSIWLLNKPVAWLVLSIMVIPYPKISNLTSLHCADGLYHYHVWQCGTNMRSCQKIHSTICHHVPPLGFAAYSSKLGCEASPSGFVEAHEILMASASITYLKNSLPTHIY